MFKSGKETLQDSNTYVHKTLVDSMAPERKTNLKVFFLISCLKHAQTEAVPRGASSVLHRMFKVGMQTELRKSRVLKANSCRIKASSRRRRYSLPVLVIRKGSHTNNQGLDTLDLKLSPNIHAEVIKVLVEHSDWSQPNCMDLSLCLFFLSREQMEIQPGSQIQVFSHLPLANIFFPHKGTPTFL